jgi:hypothetical protein
MYPDDDAVVERTTESASDGAGAPEVEAEQGQPEAETGDQAAAGEGAEAEAAVETPQPRTPWFQTRINELTRGKYDEQRRRQAAESELALVKARLTAMEGRDPAGDAATDAENVSAGPKVTRPSINITPADEIERRADELATQKAAQKAFAEACNATNAAGEKAHPDFPVLRDALNTSFGEVLGQRPEFYETITALPNGHEVFYKLAKDMDKASDVLALPRTKMIVELTRMGDEIERAGKQKAVSKAPPPLKTIDGAGRSPEVDPDKMSIGEWMKWREKEATQAHKARWTR